MRIFLDGSSRLLEHKQIPRAFVRSSLRETDQHFRAAFWHASLEDQRLFSNDPVEIRKVPRDAPLP
jgi:hypothetical protein